MDMYAKYRLFRGLTGVGFVLTLIATKRFYEAGIAGTRPSGFTIVLLFSAVIIGVIGAVCTIYMRERISNRKSADQIATETLAQAQKDNKTNKPL